jgi:hypothetical protein
MNKITKIAKDIILTLNTNGVRNNTDVNNDIQVLVEEMIQVYDDNAHHFMRLSPKITGQLCEGIKACIVWEDANVIDIVDNAVDILNIIAQFDK